MSNLADEHVEVECHVRAQQQLGDGHGALVQRTLNEHTSNDIVIASITRGYLDEILDIVRGPHDLAHILIRRELLVEEGAQVMAVGRRVDYAVEELGVQFAIRIQLLLCIKR